MKTFLLSLALACSVQSYSQTTAIPDAIFEQALINLGYDNIIDGSVLTANISAVSSLNIDGIGIGDLSGIEDFTALTYLDCRDNQLLNLNVSQNINLTELYCSSNAISSIDVSQNPLLYGFGCQENQLTNLDVSQNTLLWALYCQDNQLTTLDVSQSLGLNRLDCSNNLLISLNTSQNTDITHLYCSGNFLTSLDVSQSTNLIDFLCTSNQITSLDVTQNTALSWLSCAVNELTNLDLSQNTNLIAFQCQLNNLSCINIKNGNNSNVILFAAQYNPSVVCIEVDDIAYSTSNWTVAGGSIDPTMSFSNYCNNACTNSSSLEEFDNSQKQLVKIMDLMGRETEFKTNTTLIYIYSDGSIEKVFEVKL